MRKILSVVAVAALATLGQTAFVQSAFSQAMEKEMTGEVMNINTTTHMVTVGDTTMKWSMENSRGTKLDELSEGDQVKVVYSENQDGTNDIVDIQKAE
jgi:Cu/Ag efflux protein CusF